MDSKHKQLLEKLPSLGEWFHNIDLGDGIKTAEGQKAGSYDAFIRWNSFERYIPKDLTGKTVLDLGCNSGFYSVQMKLRGAKRVVSVDAFDVRIRQAEFLSEWFDVDLEIIKQDAETFSLTTMDRFDYVIFMGLFYHLKYPVMVLDRVAEMVNEKLVFQTTLFGEPTATFESESSYFRGQDSKLNSPEFPKMCFIERKFNNDVNTWWIVNYTGIRSLIKNARLKIVGQPSKEIFICEPGNLTSGREPFGKKTFPNLVFPRHGKDEFTIP